MTEWFPQCSEAQTRKDPSVPLGHGGVSHLASRAVAGGQDLVLGGKEPRFASRGSGMLPLLWPRAFTHFPPVQSHKL